MDARRRTLFIVLNAPTPARSGYTRRAEALAVALDRLTECRLLALVSDPNPAAEAATKDRFAADILTASATSPLRRALAQVWALARGRNRWLDRFLTDPAFRALRDRLRAFDPDLVVVGHTGLIPVLDALGVPLGQAIVDHHDPASLNVRRQMRGAGLVRRLKLALDWCDMRRGERRCAGALAQWAVSDVDRRAIESLTGVPATVMPNVVPDEAFAVEPASIVADAPPVIGFIGAYSYAPNVEAALDVIDISRALARRGVGHRAWLLGGRPPPALIRRAEGTAHIEIPGFLPDVTERLRQVTMMLAPLRTGTGTKIKILEALAMGIPVVTTSVGAEGLPLREQRLALVEDDRGGLERACERLLADPNLRAELSERGRRWAWENASQTHLNAVMEAHLRGLGSLPSAD